VTLAEAMNRKTSRIEDDETEDSSPEIQRKNSTLAKYPEIEQTQKLSTARNT